jgi:hypothetical protein
VAQEFHWSGTGISLKWHRNFIEVAQEFHWNGTGISLKWHRNFIEVAQEFHWRRMHLLPEKGTFRPTVGLVAAVNSVTPDMLQRLWSEPDYRIDDCRVTRGSTFSVCDTTWNCIRLCNCSHQFCKNIPVSFDFITTWNQIVFLCKPCIIRCTEVWTSNLNIFIIWRWTKEHFSYRLQYDQSHTQWWTPWRQCVTHHTHVILLVR